MCTTQKYRAVPWLSLIKGKWKWLGKSPFFAPRKIVLMCISQDISVASQELITQVPITLANSCILALALPPSALPSPATHSCSLKSHSQINYFDFFLCLRLCFLRNQLVTPPNSTCWGRRKVFPRHSGDSSSFEMSVLEESYIETVSRDILTEELLIILGAGHIIYI